MKTAIYANNLQVLIEENLIDIAQLDQAVFASLRTKNDLGLFENPYRGLDDKTVPVDEEKKS